LQEGVVDEQTTFMCHHGFSYAAGRFMKCHGFGPHQLNNGIYNSCNTYFANVYMRTINKYVKPSMRLMYGVIILKALDWDLWDMIYQQEKRKYS
jgi:cell division protein FtsI/penicillin-binding protein 2